MAPLVELHETFAAGPDRRVVVARFASRWFVLTGYTESPLATYRVEGPHDKHLEATRAALLAVGHVCTGAVRV